MKRSALALALPASLAMAISACGSEEPAETEPATNVADSVEVPTTTLSPLTPEQQANRDSFDVASFQQEYAQLRTDLASDTGTQVPERDNMDYQFLDRDGDGSLNVAEYALWAVPGGMNAMASSDGTYLSGVQADGVTETYFFFDEDADGSLSQAEFESARASNLVR